MVGTWSTLSRSQRNGRVADCLCGKWAMFRDLIDTDMSAQTTRSVRLKDAKRLLKHSREEFKIAKKKSVDETDKQETKDSIGDYQWLSILPGQMEHGDGVQFLLVGDWDYRRSGVFHEGRDWRHHVPYFPNLREQDMATCTGATPRESRGKVWIIFVLWRIAQSLTMFRKHSNKVLPTQNINRLSWWSMEQPIWPILRNCPDLPLTMNLSSLSLINVGSYVTPRNLAFFLDLTF